MTSAPHAWCVSNESLHWVKFQLLFRALAHACLSSSSFGLDSGLEVELAERHVTKRSIYPVRILTLRTVQNSVELWAERLLWFRFARIRAQTLVSVAEPVLASVNCDEARNERSPRLNLHGNRLRSKHEHFQIAPCGV